ncbi:MAG: hypothetical protein QOF96_1423, partial [Actinomycetota bacterium]|nr:hypothetical protein [Actinomycetota bacterium]
MISDWGGTGDNGRHGDLLPPGVSQLLPFRERMTATANGEREVRRKGQWVLLLVVACCAVLFSRILVTRDGHSGLPACEGGEPVGSERCTFPCVTLAMTEKSNCVYDPTLTATSTTSLQYVPPTTAPGS